jgi:hypothetical protein
MTTAQTIPNNDRTDSSNSAVTSNNSRKPHAHEEQISAMDKEQQNAYKEIHDLLDGQRRDKAHVWYKVGRRIAEHGKKSVAKIAELLGRDASCLNDAKRVAKTWTPQQFKTLLEKQDKVRGNHLSWSHFVEVQRVIDTELRDSLIEDVLSKGWSVRDLKQAINGPKVEGDSQPGNVAKALRNFKAEAETIVEKAARYKKLLFDVLDPPEDEELDPPENVELGTPNMLKLLQDTRQAQLEAIQTCGEQLEKLDAYIIRSEELQTTSEGEIQGTSPEAEQTRGEE